MNHFLIPNLKKLSQKKNISESHWTIQQEGSYHIQKHSGLGHPSHHLSGLLPGSILHHTANFKTCTAFTTLGMPNSLVFIQFQLQSAELG